MVSRPRADKHFGAGGRHVLDLRNAKSAALWTMSLVAKNRREKKEDTINNYGTIVALQVTNLILSTFEQDRIIKLEPNES